MGESTATIGYQIDLPKADLVFRGKFKNSITYLFNTVICIFFLFFFIGMVDSNWNVGGVLEKKLGPLPFTFSLSGMLNHSKQNFRLGCGFIIG